MATKKRGPGRPPKSSLKKNLPLPEKKVTRKRVKVESNGDDDIFEIFEPINLGSRVNAETIKRANKIDRTLKVLEVGKAFLIPANWSGWLRDYLNAKHPNRRYSISILKDDKEKEKMAQVKYVSAGVTMAPEEHKPTKKK